MRIGLLADAHGNPLGLDLCLGALWREDVEEIRFLGDAVGYMPGATQVLAHLIASGSACQKGNHEAMLLGELPLPPDRDNAYRLKETASHLSHADLEWIRSWPVSSDITIAGRRILMVHGSPTAPLTDYVYPDSPTATFADLGFDAVFMANTHRPFVKRVGPTLVANIGSCGLPRDQGDHASCAVYDTSNGSCDLLRVPMSPEAVLAQFRPSGLHPVVEATLGRRVEAFFGRIVEPV